MSNVMLFSEYESNVVNHLRSVQLMILKDFINFCDKNNIEYYSYGGTTIGAVRHGGFIPWDDDVDVIMFRKEYDKFVELFKQSSCEKYSLLSFDDTKDFFYYLTKLSLNGTEFKQSWSRNTEFKLGINIDIFILDNVPDNKVKRWLYFKKRKLLGNVFNVFIVDLNKNYSSRKIELIANIAVVFLKLFRITPEKVKNYYNNFVRKNNEKYHDFVFENGAVCYESAFKRSIFKPPIKVQFEDIMINAPNNYDEYLRTMYGDYMKLPPEDERVVHEHDYIDFGKY